MTIINKYPRRVEDWFSKETFEQIFPYAGISVVFSHDNKPFWDYESLIASINWMNSHQDSRMHNFANDSEYKLELAVFLANVQQELGDPTLNIPYKWLWPKANSRIGIEYSDTSAGGMVALMEGCIAAIAQNTKGTKPILKGDLNSIAVLNDASRYRIGLQYSDELAVRVDNMKVINQPGFGLGSGTGGGAVFQDGLVCVSDDGTLYGDVVSLINKNESIKSTKELKSSTTDRRYAALGCYAQYFGRGAVQLSYNYNYCYCSLDLFKDYRLAKYPNLIVTTDRIKFNNLPEYFGFPGINQNGNNILPKNISDTTPPARMMAWITSLWFWMVATSGRKMTCHECMQNPLYGITSVNIIINNDSGCNKGTWAWSKIEYFKRICKIMNINIQGTIVCPSKLLVK